MQDLQVVREFIVVKMIKATKYNLYNPFFTTSLFMKIRKILSIHDVTNDAARNSSL